MNVNKNDNDRIMHLNLSSVQEVPNKHWPSLYRFTVFFLQTRKYTVVNARAPSGGFSVTNKTNYPDRPVSLSPGREGPAADRPGGPTKGEERGGGHAAAALVTKR